MTTKATGRLGGWRFGLHPAAAGAMVRSIDRVELAIGDALRLELETPGAASVIHVQYFIATTSGGWAMWLSSPPDELAAHDTAIAEIVPADDDGPDRAG